MRPGYLGAAAALAAAASIFLSCSTAPEPDTAPRYESLKQAELERLAADDPAAGIEAALHLLANNPVLPVDQLEDVLRRSAGALARRYEARVAEGDFAAARTDARSLRFLSEDPDTLSRLPDGFSISLSDADLTYRMAERLWEEGTETASLFIFLEALDSRIPGSRSPCGSSRNGPAPWETARC
ncbi:MAG: hypothetical protein M0C28_22025 [Candidatus Moduliflexus flocculans]|nr:hypothetical protein [Candidatus Moduliflexus flocculans]